MLFWRSSSEAITIITAGGNCRTLSYGLNNAALRRDANTYDVTSRASLSMTTNAMDGHSNVSPVITDIELCRRHSRLCRFRAEQTEEYVLEYSRDTKYMPVCNPVIGYIKYFRNIGRMRSDNIAIPRDMLLNGVSETWFKLTCNIKNFVWHFWNNCLNVKWINLI